MQRRNAGKGPEEAMVFNCYPNFSAKASKRPAKFAVNLQVSQDPVSNKVVVRISSPGFTPGKWTRTEVRFNSADFFAGHDYEANMQLNGLAPAFLGTLYRSQIK